MIRYFYLNSCRLSRSFSIFNYYVIYRPGYCPGYCQGYCPAFVLDGHDMN